MTDATSAESHTGENTAAASPKLGIIVVNYGSHLLIERNLAPLVLSDALVVVIDNFSSSAELTAITAVANRPGWHLVASSHNRGFGAAVNLGIAEAAALDCVSFLTINPDATINEAVVAALLAHSLAEPMSLICPRVVTSAGAVEFQGAHVLMDTGNIRGIRELPAGQIPAFRLNESGAAAPDRRRRGWLTGACVIMHATLLERVSGFDESYFLYWEDVDLSYRCEQAGGSLVVRTDLTVVHDEGGTQGERQGRAKSNGYYRYNCENRLRFAAGRLPRRQLLRWIVATPAASWQILLRGGRRQLVHSPRPLAAAVSGSLRGLALAVRALVLGAADPALPMLSSAPNPVPSAGERRAERVGAEQAGP